MLSNDSEGCHPSQGCVWCQSLCQTWVRRRWTCHRLGCLLRYSPPGVLVTTNVKSDADLGGIRWKLPQITDLFNLDTPLYQNVRLPPSISILSRTLSHRNRLFVPNLVCWFVFTFCDRKREYLDGLTRLNPPNLLSWNVVAASASAPVMQDPQWSASIHLRSAATHLYHHLDFSKVTSKANWWSEAFDQKRLNNLCQTHAVQTAGDFRVEGCQGCKITIRTRTRK